MTDNKKAESHEGIGRDPKTEIDKFIPEDIRELYDVYSYRHASAILSNSEPDELNEIFEALRNFRLTIDMIKKGGGNESEIPKEFNRLLRQKEWLETRIHGDLLVVQKIKQNNGKQIENHFMHEKFLDGHKVDYVKKKVAFDLEWNSKDQTFDRDLYAARAFYDCGLISAGVLVTRSKDLDLVFARLGSKIKNKYGASTTWIGKLLPRLDSGRNGGCPILAFAITRRLIIDWKD